jgi:hypothetical protein
MLRSAVLPVVCAMLLASVAAAAPIHLNARLTTSQETTPVVLTNEDTGGSRPTPWGYADLYLNDAMTELTMTITIWNIDVTGSQTSYDNDNLTVAHIHGPAPLGVSAGVKWGFFGSPDNDISPNDLVVVPFAMGVGGTFTSKWDAVEGNGTTLTDQLPNLLAGLMYLNFHTVQNGPGEIRGQIMVTPEPGALALTAVGIAGLLALRRRR